MGLFVQIKAFLVSHFVVIACINKGVVSYLSCNIMLIVDPRSLHPAHQEQGPCRQQKISTLEIMWRRIVGRPPISVWRINFLRPTGHHQTQSCRVVQWESVHDQSPQASPVTGTIIIPNHEFLDELGDHGSSSPEWRYSTEIFSLPFINHASMQVLSWAGKVVVMSLQDSNKMESGKLQ